MAEDVRLTYSATAIAGGPSVPLRLTAIHVLKDGQYVEVGIDTAEGVEAMLSTIRFGCGDDIPDEPADG